MQMGGSTFVITGSACRFGAVVTRMIVDECGRVGLINLDEATGKKLKAELGDSDLFRETDIAAPVEIQRGIDGAVCCAAARDELRPNETSVARLTRFADAVNVGLAGAVHRWITGGAVGDWVARPRRGSRARRHCAERSPVGRRDVRWLGLSCGRQIDEALASCASDELGCALSTPPPARPARPSEFAYFVRDICENCMINGRRSSSKKPRFWRMDWHREALHETHR